MIAYSLHFLHQNKLLKSLKLKAPISKNVNIATKNSVGGANKLETSKKSNSLPGLKDIGSSTSVSTLENRKGTPDWRKTEHVIELPPDVKNADPPSNSISNDTSTQN